MNKFYTGIGSRHTPKDILQLMTKIATYLDEKGYVLRSGGADGADTAFEKGSTNKEIYLPWKGFNDSDSELYNIPEKAFEMASKVHPVWDTLKDYVKRFHSRNVLQVLGQDLETPSDFVVCWTRNGKLVGGTAQAMRIAMLNEVPIFNLAIEEEKERILKAL